tara:strand:+ start:1974 stop:2246 length:273 start_codon:yes stop_codon:yes gene_type:complete
MVPDPIQTASHPRWTNVEQVQLEELSLNPVKVNVIQSDRAFATAVAAVVSQLPATLAPFTIDDLDDVIDEAFDAAINCSFGCHDRSPFRF